ncbi:protein BIG GRAIN 1-like B [Arachis duranensis]|uniref:Protein BIG GRAIN 1-like B n=1 Tax=Arachis duranensis TaxID=130453 RepID=A0A6P4BTE9_ARADU|nr:protein BIG GRAIN 1-like B [Arachis duranensis]
MPLYKVQLFLSCPLTTTNIIFPLSSSNMNTLTQHHSQYPSFSSTLLDKIYRSIDEGQTTHTTPIHSKVTTTTTTTRHHRHHLHHNNFNTSSESTSSSSGGLSSSSSCFARSRPKPVRTTTSIDDGEEVFIKSKSRALKIYNNLKKVKQPISPGGRLTTFLNSLFNTAANSKKTTKPASSSSSYYDATAHTKASSTCSSASSFSRSCLSKTTSSSSRDNNNNNGVKRTVRFYPVSVIVGEDSRPCGHKCLYEEEQVSVSVPTAWKIGRSSSKKSDKELKFPAMEKRDFDEDDDEDDDAASDSSSDLFELDHLAVIGNHRHHHRYCEELPVYETTHVTTNRAIANGLLM